MPPQIRIRSATVGDIPQLTLLLGKLFSIETDFIMDAERQAQGLRLMLSAPQTRTVLVAVCRDAVIGMCSGQAVISTSEGGVSVRIEDVFVEPEFRGAGIGRLLMQAITDWADARQARRLELLADCTNAPAGFFYRRLGWHQTKMVCWQHRRDGTPPVDC